MYSHFISKKGKKIYAIDSDGEYKYNFKNVNYSIDEYAMFMEKTGLFELISKHIINNLVDYVLGIEVGLSSNGRKNRGGHLMEELVESYLKSERLQYYREMELHEIEKTWDIDLSSLVDDEGKRFDFVVKTEDCIYGIECNFYASSGSKLNETARSYELIARRAKNIKGFKFVWFTDGIGWRNAKNNLKAVFDIHSDIYSIDDLEKGIVSKIFK